jgi:acyl-CoA thioesterase-1
MLAGLSLWIYNIIRLRNDVRSFSNYWSIPQGETGGLVYLALGDSAAQGIGASRPGRGYVGLIADQIRMQTSRPVQVINISKSGAKLSDVIRDQLPLVARYKADIITVDIGGNDIRHYSKEQYEKQIDQLTSQLPKGTIIADIPYFMHGKWERDSISAAEIITCQALRNGLSVAKLHDQMSDRGLKSMLSDFAADWFHPNDNGYKIWAKAFESPIRERLKAATKPAT